MAGRELTQSIKYLSKLIPRLHLFISPTLSFVHDLQEEIGQCNIAKINGSESGLWMTAICLTCQTEKLHTEDDLTYTVISVPEQELTEHEPFFMFELMNKFTLGIKMEAGLSFLSSGKYLTHRQVIPDSSSKDGNFINVASYGNRRLYIHIKSTVKRVIEYFYCMYLIILYQIPYHQYEGIYHTVNHCFFLDNACYDLVIYPSLYLLTVIN